MNDNSCTYFIYPILYKYAAISVGCLKLPTLGRDDFVCILKDTYLFTSIYYFFVIVNPFYTSIRHRFNDLLGSRVRAVLGTRKEYELPQRAPRSDTSHANGLHLYTDVLHLSQQ